MLTQKIRSRRSYCGSAAEPQASTASELLLGDRAQHSPGSQHGAPSFVPPAQLVELLLTPAQGEKHRAGTLTAHEGSDHLLLMLYGSVCRHKCVLLSQPVPKEPLTQHSPA